MKTFRALLPLLFCAAHAVPAIAADQVESFAEMLDQPTYRTSWQAMLKGEKKVPAWVLKANGPSSPYAPATIAGKPVITGFICKQHNCGDNQLYAALSAESGTAWGLLITIKDTPDAIQHPSKYASYRWFGKPDDDMKIYLMGQLKADPNWK